LLIDALGPWSDWLDSGYDANSKLKMRVSGNYAEQSRSTIAAKQHDYTHRGNRACRNFDRVQHHPGRLRSIKYELSFALEVLLTTVSSALEF
jgi:hypothetical protein